LQIQVEKEPTTTHLDSEKIQVEKEPTTTHLDSEIVSNKLPSGEKGVQAWQT